MRYSSIFILFILLFCKTAVSQELNFKHYTVNDGLPSSQVHDIVQDKYGRLWFSTDQGLSSYDGYQFTNYTTNNGLTDNVIFKFHPQENGDIWCTTFNKSLFCITGKAPSFKVYPYNKKLVELQDAFATSNLHFSKADGVFMGFYNGGGYIHIDPNGKTLHNSTGMFEPKKNITFLGRPSGEFFCFVRRGGADIRSESKWTYRLNSCLPTKSHGGLRACFFQEKKKVIFAFSTGLCISKLDASDSLLIPETHEAISIGRLNDSLFWVGLRYGGLKIYDLSGHVIRSFLPGKSVTRLFIDHEGGLWLSTLNDGLFYTNNFSVISYRNTSESWVNSLIKDEYNNLWIGYYNGDVSIMTNNTFSRKYSSTSKLPAIIRKNGFSGDIYFSSDNKIFSSFGKDLGHVINFLNITVHKNDSFLISEYAKIMVLHNKSKKVIETGFRINDICYFKGKFYLASNKGIYELYKDEVRRAKNKKLPFVKITDLDTWNNSLLLATNGSGVLIHTADSVQKISEEDGLSNSIVNKLYVENDSVFWACTNRGLNRIVLKKNFHPYIDIISEQNGLICDEITDIAIIKDTVWAGTREGLCCFPVSMIFQKKKDKDHFLQLSYLKVNDSIAQAEQQKELAYDQNRIEFGFKAISFGNQIIYRYKLIGLERDWNHTQQLSSVYTSLPPGTYTFCVQVKGTNTTWETGQQNFVFTIKPPFWSTWWFRLSIVVLVTLMIYAFFKFRILTYNRDITRELLRQLLKRLSKKTNYVVFREQGKDIRIPTHTICYVKSDGNYIEIHTDTKKYVIRYKIGNFLELVPDPLEYLRISRSCIIRLDKIQEKSKKDITVKGEKMTVGETYHEELTKIKF